MIVKENQWGEFLELENKVRKMLVLTEDRPISEQISLEDYKIQVYLCLRQIQRYSKSVASNRMLEYRLDFLEFYANDWLPNVAACAMVMNY